MRETVRFSALVEPANEMLVTDATDPWDAIAQFDAMLAAGNTVAALLRMSTDEFGDHRVTQIPLPLPDRTAPPVLPPELRAWVVRQQTLAARSAWARGYAFAYWQERGEHNRDDLPTHLTADLETWNPYPALEPRSTDDVEMAAKDQHTRSTTEKGITTS